VHHADHRSSVLRFSAIQMFLAQDYDDKELVIVDDGADCATLVPSRRGIRYIREHARMHIGSKRNLACEVAHGDIIVH
jgi:hypothetical protein